MSETPIVAEPRVFFGQTWFLRIMLGLVFALGLGIRLYDLTDPPLGSRELGSAVISRGMYYQELDSAPEWQREAAIATWRGRGKSEPRILERIVATTYHIMGGEYLWVSRIYTSIVWLIGGVALYLLARDLTNPDGAVIAVVYYLFIPFGVTYSRSFQPDPLMVAMMVISLLAFYRWNQKPTWQRTLVAGLVSGLAILIKVVAVFPVLGALAGITLAKRGILGSLKDSKVWVLGGLALLPAVIYNFFLVPDVSSGFFKFWVVNYIHLIVDPAFYVRWTDVISVRMGFHVVVLGLWGVLLFRPGSDRWMVIGTWVGYVLYGLFLPYQIMTHGYYHLMLVAILALSLSPLAASILRHIADQGVRFRIAAFIVLIFGIFYQVWTSRVNMARSDNRGEAAYWQEIKEEFPRDGSVIALTQDYGFRMAYFAWIKPGLWPITADMWLDELRGEDEFDYQEEFAIRTKGIDYFLVTDFKDFERQDELQDILYDNYPLYKRGESYLLFDLRQKLNDGGE